MTLLFLKNGFVWFSDIKVGVIPQQLLHTMGFMRLFENSAPYGAHDEDDPEEEGEGAEKGGEGTDGLEELQEEEELQDGGDF